MDQFTQMLDDWSDVLTPEDENYEDRLLQIARLFKTFGEALTEYINNIGYSDDLSDTAGKVNFLRGKCKAAGIDPPRDMNKWFEGGKELTRETIFRLCFAFGLNVSQTDDFFRRVFLERSFDCHSINEAVYFFCFRTGRTWKEAQEIIAQLPKIKSVGDIRTNREVLYTGTIRKFIEGIQNPEDLIRYIKDHADQFGYNNATATRHIQRLWAELSKENGLAYREGLLLGRQFNHPHGKGESDDDDYMVAHQKGDSVWHIYAQIMGLDKRQTRQYGGESRNIRPLLANNALLPAMAEKSFPDRDGIEKLLGGKHLSHDRVRKILILLQFYTYWADVVVRSGDAHVQADEFDAERCIDKINAYLLETGHQELYYGNPYDWIFLWAAKDPCPLLAFRFYLGELYAHQSSRLAGETAANPDF